MLGCRRFSLDLAHLYYVRSTLDVGEAASKAGADAAISKDAPLPNIICSLRQLAG